MGWGGRIRHRDPGGLRSMEPMAGVLRRRCFAWAGGPGSTGRRSPSPARPAERTWPMGAGNGPAVPGGKAASRGRAARGGRTAAPRRGMRKPGPDAPGWWPGTVPRQPAGSSSPHRCDPWAECTAPAPCPHPARSLLGRHRVGAAPAPAVVRGPRYGRGCPPSRRHRHLGGEAEGERRGAIGVEPDSPLKADLRP